MYYKSLCAPVLRGLFENPSKPRPVKNFVNQHPSNYWNFKKTIGTLQKMIRVWCFYKLGSQDFYKHILSRDDETNDKTTYKDYSDEDCMIILAL